MAEGVVKTVESLSVDIKDNMCARLSCTENESENKNNENES